MTTPLYHRTMEWATNNLDADGQDLQHKVWDGTPWMVNAYTGRIGSGFERDLMDWCRDQFGEEAWPIHGKPGQWHRGGATIHGWTWIGFATEEQMNRFAAVWRTEDDSASEEGGAA